MTVAGRSIYPALITKPLAAPLRDDHSQYPHGPDNRARRAPSGHIP
ncbi:hypothetical protein SAMN05216215_104461 [Saccharopolyspora shandongensis]|uniref:Uncharacterized protein n=1 Tax=Saccharopolyspora shandongensis TaxID=418495 RepID=A0A1H3PWX6_9PSEU|nr:hypothetical protein SAMN05216215_104461 [Saccharopolyspora shandongensis]